MAVGSTYPAAFFDLNVQPRLEGTIQFTDSTNQPNVPNPITSGALPTVSLSSGTGAQASTSRNVFSVTPVTYDASNNAASCKVELSPDNVTYSTLVTLSLAAAVNNTGAIVDSVNVPIPAGWYIKLTATHATLGTTTYF